ncbi:MAG: monovalent cation/H+ antiporter subunit D family protein [Deltaproteobacteria bacterium]|nr:monovalent cation/H+ antiporter subunit D family protein [Deltaproteobacteria bacterium]
MSAEPTVITSARPLIPVLMTFAAPFVIRLFRNRMNLRETVSFLFSGLTFILVLLMAPAILKGTIYKITLFTLLPGLTISFCADGLSLIFALVSSFLWIFATSYNIGYMRSLKEHAQTRYYVCFAVAIFGAQGVAFSGNIFTLYLFYEIITLFTYPLVAHHQDDDGYAAGRKYLIYLMGTSKLFFLPALVLTYVLCGTLDFHLGDIRQGIFPATANPALVTLTYILYLAGIAKAAIMPLHNWLPSAMVAPTPVSALLHAVAVVKAGVFAICRIILSCFGVETMEHLGLGLPTAYVTAFTVIAAALIALTKDDIKARIAYSTVSQLSYIILGVAMLTPDSIDGGLSFIAHHAFPKITLFFAAGAIFVSTGLRQISHMHGLGKRMPWTFGAFALATLAFVGLPPVSGFVSKFYMATGAADAAMIGLMFAILVSALLNLAYLGPVVYKAFFLPPAEGMDLSPYGEAPLTMLVPLVLTALISILLGFYPESFVGFSNVFTHF